MGGGDGDICMPLQQQHLLQMQIGLAKPKKKNCGESDGERVTRVTVVGVRMCLYLSPVVCLAGHCFPGCHLLLGSRSLVSQSVRETGRRTRHATANETHLSRAVQASRETLRLQRTLEKRKENII